MHKHFRRANANAESNSHCEFHSDTKPQSHSHAKAPADTDGATHFAASPDAAAASSYKYAYCSAKTHFAASPHTGAASTFAASHSTASAQSLAIKAKVSLEVVWERYAGQRDREIEVEIGSVASRHLRNAQRPTNKPDVAHGSEAPSFLGVLLP